MLPRVVLLCINLFVLNIKADAVGINLKISGRGNKIFCDQNTTNLNKHEITVQDGHPLRIKVDFRYYINHIQCVANSNSRVLVWNHRKYSKKEIMVPKVVDKMSGNWNCTILTLKEISGPSPMVFVNGYHYIAVYCAFRVNVRQTDAAEMKLKISYNDNYIFCEQNKTNIDKHEVTIPEEGKLNIAVDFDKYVNYIQCTDYFNSNRVFVRNPSVKSSRKIITVPQITADMAGIWNCTILSHRDVRGIARVVTVNGISVSQNISWLPMVVVNDHRYVASYCAFKVNVGSD